MEGKRVEGKTDGVDDMEGEEGVNRGKWCGNEFRGRGRGWN